MSKTSIMVIVAVAALAAATDASSARTGHRVMHYTCAAYGQAPNIAGVKTRTDAAHARAVYRNPDRGMPVPCHGSAC